jgi:hypothetical protein
MKSFKYYEVHVNGNYLNNYGTLEKAQKVADSVKSKSKKDKVEIKEKESFSTPVEMKVL